MAITKTNKKKHKQKPTKKPKKIVISSLIELLKLILLYKSSKTFNIENQQKNKKKTQKQKRKTKKKIFIVDVQIQPKRLMRER